MRCIPLVVGLAFTATACAAGQPGNTEPNSASAPSVAAGLPQQQQVAPCHVVNGQADRRCTPGVLNPNVTQGTTHTTICVKGWTATVRPSVAYTDGLKHQQMVQYGETGSPQGFEEDHLIALEVGGAPADPKNLWPEPRNGPHPAAEKDSMENAVHAAICAGRITLKQGQDQMLAKWSR